MKHSVLVSILVLFNIYTIYPMDESTLTKVLNSCDMYTTDPVKAQRLKDAAQNLSKSPNFEADLMNNINNELEIFCKSTNLSSVTTGPALTKFISQQVNSAIHNTQLYYMTAGALISQVLSQVNPELIDAIVNQKNKTILSFVQDRWKKLNLEPQVVSPAHIYAVQAEVKQKLQRLLNTKAILLAEHNPTGLSTELNNYMEEQITSIRENLSSIHIVEEISVFTGKSYEIPCNFEIKTKVQIKIPQNVNVILAHKVDFAIQVQPPTYT